MEEIRQEIDRVLGLELGGFKIKDWGGLERDYDIIVFGRCSKMKALKLSINKLLVLISKIF